jgi:hypothetical protein
MLDALREVVQRGGVVMRLSMDGREDHTYQRVGEPPGLEFGCDVQFNFGVDAQEAAQLTGYQPINPRLRPPVPDSERP